VLYLWGLGASGWANAFYSAAAQAGAAADHLSRAGADSPASARQDGKTHATALRR